MAEQRKPHTRRPSCRHLPGRVRPRHAFYYTYPRAPTYISPENYRQREEFTYYAASAVGYVRPLPSLRFCTFRPNINKTDVVLGKKKINLQWEAGLISQSNFTDADALPEKEWSADPPIEIFSNSWSQFVDNEEEY